MSLELASACPSRRLPASSGWYCARAYSRCQHLAMNVATPRDPPRRTPDTMRAMVLDRPGVPLELRDLPVPHAGPGEVLLRARACGLCRTDLHVVDGELPEPKLPLVPGHQIVGEVVAAGEGARRFAVGERVGVPWLGWTCC